MSRSGQECLLAFQKMRSKYLNKNSFDGKKERFKYKHVFFSADPGIPRLNLLIIRIVMVKLILVLVQN